MPFTLHQVQVLYLYIVSILSQNCQLSLSPLFTSLIHFKLLFSCYQFYYPVNYFSLSLKILIILYPAVEFFYNKFLIHSWLELLRFILAHVNFIALSKLLQYFETMGYAYLCVCVFPVILWNHMDNIVFCFPATINKS